MFSRRKFLKSAAMASVMTGAANQLRAMTGTGATVTGTTGTGANTKQQPVVVSTWDYGKKANVGAWNILGKGGRALDAVEAGVMIAEADPNARTVGYGGLPDRDGIVTLDASIMDEKYNCGSVMCLENIMHPISVARMIMEKTPHIALAGAGRCSLRWLMDLRK